MTMETVVHAEQKQIEELRDHEIGWAYSLSKWGKWEDSKIASQFNFSECDARNSREKPAATREAAAKSVTAKDRGEAA